MLSDLVAAAGEALHTAQPFSPVDKWLQSDGRPVVRLIAHLESWPPSLATMGGQPSGVGVSTPPLAPTPDPSYASIFNGRHGTRLRESRPFVEVNPQPTSHSTAEPGTVGGAQNPPIVLATATTKAPGSAVVFGGTPPSLCTTAKRPSAGPSDSKSPPTAQALNDSHTTLGGGEGSNSQLVKEEGCGK